MLCLSLSVSARTGAPLQDWNFVAGALLGPTGWPSQGMGAPDTGAMSDLQTLQSFHFGPAGLVMAPDPEVSPGVDP